ncbi:HNH endonuclease [Burkholderia multivorans]|uniref:HNH endonuclease n=1 Tax=Burkholderia multivorans TaxID=87883 RepID=UPI00158E935B|nr:HNH endonuclease signature motif containing protein [Burkholderia multivorans]
MGSKKNKGKTCVYCGVAPSTTGDHVIAREFFPKDARDNLPKVPACAKCNFDKSKLEHYLLTLLPIGGRHEGALAAITDQVVPRLAKNAALDRTLAAGQRPFFVLDEGRPWQAWVATPLDVTKLTDLACFIAVGLASYHWQIQLMPRARADARRLTEKGRTMMAADLAGPAAGARVERNLGNGVFYYQGAYQRTNPMQTIWEMSFFGGVEIGPMNMSGESTRSVTVVTSDRPDWLARFPDRKIGGGQK